MQVWYLIIISTGVYLKNKLRTEKQNAFISVECDDNCKLKLECNQMLLLKTTYFCQSSKQCSILVICCANVA